MNEELLIKCLETTSRCNYSCPICVPRTRNCDLDMKDFYSIIDNNLDIFQKKSVWLHFNGEPLVDPYFFDRVEYMHSKAIKTRVSTNGALLNAENRYKVAKANISNFVISVGTLDKDMYKKMKGIDNLQEILNNITELKKCIDETGSKTKLQAVMIDVGEGTEKKEEFIKYFHNLGINVAVHNFTNRAQNIKNDIVINKKDNKVCKRGECIGLKSNIIILSDCEVVTCYSDFLAQNSLGNLKDYDYSVKKLVENGKLQKIISNLQHNKYEGACKNCSDWIYYQKNVDEKYVTVYPVM